MAVAVLFNNTKQHGETAAWQGRYISEVAGGAPVPPCSKRLGSNQSVRDRLQRKPNPINLPASPEAWQSAFVPGHNTQAPLGVTTPKRLSLQRCAAAARSRTAARVQRRRGMQACGRSLGHGQQGDGRSDDNKSSLHGKIKQRSWGSWGSGNLPNVRAARFVANPRHRQSLDSLSIFDDRARNAQRFTIITWQRQGPKPRCCAFWCSLFR